MNLIIIIKLPNYLSDKHLLSILFSIILNNTLLSLVKNVLSNLNILLKNNITIPNLLVHDKKTSVEFLKRITYNVSRKLE